MIKKLSLALIIISCVACTGPNHSFTLRKPMALDMNPPEGPENYQQGWLDGCKTGVASTSTAFYQTVGAYRFTLDNNLRYDRLYNTAWRYGFNHCGYTMKALAQYSL